MSKIGRNSICPCGSGKKYKHCCENKELEMQKTEVASGRFRFTAGSYGSSKHGYMPSILCEKQTGKNSWKKHFYLLKHDVEFKDEEKAVVTAEQHIAAASNVQQDGGTPQDFALYLRHQGYKKIDKLSFLLN